MALVDQYGNPIRKQELLEEQATPSITGVRNILGNYQSGGLDPQRVARILRQADEGEATAYYELAEEIEEKDAHYSAVLGTRKRAVAQLEITVTPASDDKADLEKADFIQEWLNRDQLESELFSMLDAIGKGHSVTEMLWDTSSGAWLPRDLKWRDPRWFEFSRTDGETLFLKEAAQLVPLQPYKFIIHKVQSKSGLTVRGGVIRPCVWMWLFKNFSIKDWVIFAEAYGQPIRVGKYNPGASKEDRDVLMKAVANIGSDAAAIIPNSMVIEFIEAQGKTGTADVFKNLCNFADQQMSKAVLGQTTTTDSLTGGGLAGNQSHNEVREDIERADAKQLAATLNAQLIKPIIDLNFGEQKKYPRLRIGRSQQIDPAKLAQAAETGQRMGIQISASKLRDQLSLPAPIDKDDVLVAIPTQAKPKETASQRHRKATAAEGSETDGSFDDAVDDLASNYEEVVSPTLDVIQELLDNSADYDEFLERLLTAPGIINTDEIASALDKATLNARLAGNAEVKIK